MIGISDRIKDVQFGGLYEIFAKASELEAGGKKLVHMEIGRPDFVSPTLACEEVKKALDAGFVHYTAVRGVMELREAVAEKEKRRHNLEYDPETEIIITAGACEALTTSFLAMLNPGDEVIVPGPYFSAYMETSLFSQYKIVELKMSLDNGWELNPEDLKKLYTDRTKAILINSPNNPAGYVLSKEQLQIIADFAIEKDLLVVSDECYDEFIYEGEPISISQLEGMKERTLVIKSASKSYSMTGWRVGYIMGPAKYMGYMEKIHQNLSTCATSFAQYGAIAAYKHGDEFIDNMVSTFNERRKYFYDKLSKVDGLEIANPKGAFYMFPRITNYGKTGDEICKILMDEAGVVGVPGRFFGNSGEDYIRLAYCRDMEDLETAANNIKKVLESL